MHYLWGVATQFIMWLSAIFYTVDSLGENLRRVFWLNPLYSYIYYFRSVVLEGAVPPLFVHALVLGHACIAFGIGAWMYKRYNTEFLYYV